MPGVKSRKWILKSRFDGTPKREDLDIVEEILPPIKDGEFLCESEWLSVDPYHRIFANILPLGSTMVGTQVAKVIESKNKDYSVGDYIVGEFGWVTHAIGNSSSERLMKLDPSLPAKMHSTGLGVLGMPGATAYFGLLDVSKPKKGETLVVNAAAGAVGSLVGQIGKIKGCRVVGFAGSDAKVKYLKSLGFDAAYNYKTISSLDETIKEACPNGVDLFFDLVGGEFLSTVVHNMNEFGRVSLCGAISEYNVREPKPVKPFSQNVVFKQLKLEGFLVWKWFDQWPAAFKEMRTWISEGKLKYNETVTNGFDNMFEAFMDLFKGGNTGKVIVKA